MIAVLTEGPLYFEFSVLRSTDGGHSWQEVYDGAQATIPTTAEAWAIDHDDRLLIGGMSMATSGVIFLSADDGATWEEITFPFGPGVMSLAVDSQNNIYAPLGNNDLFVSLDHGATWTEIPNGGWPTGTSRLLDEVAVDAQDGIVLSSRAAGIWRSTDGGAAWVLFDDGLAAYDYPEVSFIEPVADALFAGTRGDGLFRRDLPAVGVGPALAPARVTLLDAIPNPFNPRTTIRYELATSATVRITVHDLAGRLVRTLTDGRHRPAGRHETVWDGRDGNGGDLPSGVYLVRIEAAGIRIAGKLMLAR